MKINKWSIITPLSLILFIVALFFLKRGTDFVIAVTVSILLHELAHGLMLRTTGQKFNMVFIPLLAAGVIPTDVKKYLSLPAFKQASIALAGPLVNAILMFVGVLLYKQTGSGLGFQLMTINFTLIVLNIAPIGPFDGSKIASAILKSVTSWWIKVPLALYFMAVALIALFFFFSDNGSISNTWFAAIVAISVLGVITKLIPTHDGIRSMTRTQSGITFGLYFFMAILNFATVFTFFASNTLKLF